MSHPPKTVQPSISIVGRGVIGVALRSDKILVARRADQIVHGGFWCFPGGHVEPNETPKRALVREFNEELGVQVEAVQRIGAVRVLDVPRYILAVWQIGLIEDELRPNPDEIAEVRWGTPSQLRALKPSLPSNAHVLSLLGL